MADMARMMNNSGGANGKANGNVAGPGGAGGQKKPPELKATLYTWRERLPNKWDSLKEWDDIFSWRTEVGLEGDVNSWRHRTVTVRVGDLVVRR